MHRVMCTLLTLNLLVRMTYVLDFFSFRREEEKGHINEVVTGNGYELRCINNSVEAKALWKVKCEY